MIALWQEVMEELKLSIEPNALKTWFKHARIHNIDKSEMVCVDLCNKRVCGRLDEEAFSTRSKKCSEKGTPYN